MKTLRQKKLEATKQENERVFGDMNTPKNIVVEHEGQTYIRRAWTSLNKFGWDKWEVVK